VGTDDATSDGNLFNGSNAGTGNNMVKTSSNVYDNSGAGDGNLTETIEYPGAGQANRATFNFYDWRDRMVASKSGALVNSDGSANTSAETDGAARPQKEKGSGSNSI
jgi:hypothetical protein